MSQPVSDELANFTILRQPAPELGPRAQRTIARIIEATREVFLSYGYAGTTIDEIARVAKVSRASFYTYFPSKRDVLLAAGARSSGQATALLEEIPATVRSFDDLNAWVTTYFAFLEAEGAFAFAWTQAATNDEEIRAAGLQRHVHMARRLGEVLIAIGSTGRTDALELGLAMFGLLDRTWAFAHLYGDSVDRVAVERTVALTMWAAAHQDPTQV
jgi:AcrR family transcriptional regulator